MAFNVQVICTIVSILEINKTPENHSNAERGNDQRRYFFRITTDVINETFQKNQRIYPK